MCGNQRITDRIPSSFPPVDPKDGSSGLEALISIC